MIVHRRVTTRRVLAVVVAGGTAALTPAVAIAAPAPAGAAKPIPGMLLGVDGTSARNVWAVGTSPAGTLAEHWNGSGWKKVPTPSPGSGRSHEDVLEAVATLSPANVWAAGYFTFGRQPVHPSVRPASRARCATIAG